MVLTFKIYIPTFVLLRVFTPQPMPKASKAKSGRYSKSRKSAMGTAASRYAESEKKRKKNPNLKTPFTAGNQYWNRRSKHGKDAIFSSPNIMKESMAEYFITHLNPDNHQWAKKEWKIVNGKAKLVEIKLIPPYTWEGVCLFLHVSTGYFRAFKSTLKQDDPQRADYLSVIEWADNIIRENKFHGASVGAFNANLISYDLGIRKDMPQGTGSAGVVINVNENKDKALLNDVMNKLNELDKEK